MMQQEPHFKQIGGMHAPGRATLEIDQRAESRQKIVPDSEG
jgi:hypothetical protein